MKVGIIQSSSGQSATLSYGAVQKALLGLEEKAVISKAGDTNREGTLYKINLPEEIEICQKLIAATKTKETVPIDETNELDYYNIAENRLKVFERDDYKCHYCSKQLTRFTASLDHIQPVSEGGDNSYENLVTACLHCNSRRGSQPVMAMYTKGNENSR
jgi:DNA-directed RNA polymerase subunit RPC12/RpoP